MKLSESEFFYREIKRIRRVEEELARIYPTDKIQSPIHLSIGQEAVSVGVCHHLDKKDIVFGTYRSHGLFLAKGGNLAAMIAELFGKSTGCSKGKGGSMHLVDVDAGIMGTSAIVGTLLPQAAGFAYALQSQKKSGLVVCFFGDGATEEGVFHETLNFAALKKLPVLFVCENNLYAVHSHQKDRQALSNIADRAGIYGIPFEKLEGQDVFSVSEKAKQALQFIRSGAGPYFLECMTYRFREHVGPREDFDLGYRSSEEGDEWKKRDPLFLISQKVSEEFKRKIDSEIESEIQCAVRFAEKSPFPKAEDLDTDLFIENKKEIYTSLTPQNSSRRISYAQAIYEATFQEMKQDPSVMVMGIGVDDFKGTYGTTLDLQKVFGPSRAFDTPLAEEGMTGIAIGAALGGMRPIHVHIRMDFLMLAMNQLVNMAAKISLMSGGNLSVHLVVRVVIGRSWGQGAQHSQALHALLMHIPGLRVVAPATPFDAKGLLIQSIRDPNPVIFVEHRLLHSVMGEVPESSYVIPFGQARILEKGSDITLVGISWMAQECLRARKLLLEHGIHAEVIDPVSLSPLDLITIMDSAKKTKNLLVVDTSWTFCGAGAEILAGLAEQGFASEIKMKRMGYAPTNCPTSQPLESLFYPDAGKIVDVVHQMLETQSQKSCDTLDEVIIPRGL